MNQESPVAFRRENGERISASAVSARNGDLMSTTLSIRRLNMSRKTIKKYILLLLTAAVMLSTCACGSISIIQVDTDEVRTDDSPDAIENLTVSYQVELDTLNPYAITTDADSKLLSNLYDSLVTLDSGNNYIPCLAESWETNEDNTVWTFHLKKNAYWVNYRGEKLDRIVSEDFITGLEFVLNPRKINSISAEYVKDVIAGASEYYEKMAALSTDEGREAPIDGFLSTVGIETPDEFTVIYKCSSPCPYFLSIASETALMPASSRHISELGIDEFIRNSVFNAWYSGPYLLTEFIPDNERIIDANPHWHGNDSHTRFKSVTFKYIPENSICQNLYKNGELDYVELSQSKINQIMKSDNQDDKDRIISARPRGYSMTLMYNYNKLFEDGTRDNNWNRTILNDAFRKSLKYGMNFTSFLALYNPLDKYGIQTATQCLDNLCKNLDGKDYSAIVLEKIGLSEIPSDSLIYFDRGKALSYKKEAMKQLNAAGVTFPVTLDYYVSATSSKSLSGALVLKSCIEGTLGKDYIEVRIKTYASNITTEVLNKKLQSAYFTAWGADFADPKAILFQYIYGNPYAYMSAQATNMDDLEIYYNKTHDEYVKPFIDKMTEYTRLYYEADAINDINERYNAFADAEAYLLENNLVGFTMFREKENCFSRIDVNSFVPSICSGSTYRYVDIKTDINGYRK